MENSNNFLGFPWKGKKVKPEEAESQEEAKTSEKAQPALPPPPEPNNQEIVSIVNKQASANEISVTGMPKVSEIRNSLPNISQQQAIDNKEPKRLEDNGTQIDNKEPKQVDGKESKQVEGKKPLELDGKDPKQLEEGEIKEDQQERPEVRWRFAENIAGTIATREETRLEQRYSRTFLGKMNVGLNRALQENKGLKIGLKVLLGGTAAAGAFALAGTAGMLAAPIMFSLGAKLGFDGVIEGVQEAVILGKKRKELQDRKDAFKVRYLEDIQNLHQMFSYLQAGQISPEEFHGYFEKTVTALETEELEIEKAEQENTELETKHRRIRGLASTGASIALGVFTGVPLGVQHFHGLPAQAAHAGMDPNTPHRVIANIGQLFQHGPKSAETFQFLYNSAVESHLPAGSHALLNGVQHLWTGASHTLGHLPPNEAFAGLGIGMAGLVAKTTEEMLVLGKKVGLDKVVSAMRGINGQGKAVGKPLGERGMVVETGRDDKNILNPEADYRAAETKPGEVSYLAVLEKLVAEGEKNAEEPKQEEKKEAAETNLPDEEKLAAAILKAQQDLEAAGLTIDKQALLKLVLEQEKKKAGKKSEQKAIEGKTTVEDEKKTAYERLKERAENFITFGSFDLDDDIVDESEEDSLDELFEKGASVNEKELSTKLLEELKNSTVTADEDEERRLRVLINYLEGKKVVSEKKGNGEGGQQTEEEKKKEEGPRPVDQKDVLDRVEARTSNYVEYGVFAPNTNPIAEPTSALNEFLESNNHQERLKCVVRALNTLDKLYGSSILNLQADKWLRYQGLRDALRDENTRLRTELNGSKKEESNSDNSSQNADQKKDQPAPEVKTGVQNGGEETASNDGEERINNSGEAPEPNQSNNQSEKQPLSTELEPTTGWAESNNRLDESTRQAHDKRALEFREKNRESTELINQVHNRIFRDSWGTAKPGNRYVLYGGVKAIPIIAKEMAELKAEHPEAAVKIIIHPTEQDEVEGWRDDTPSYDEVDAASPYFVKPNTPKLGEYLTDVVLAGEYGYQGIKLKVLKD